MDIIETIKSKIGSIGAGIALMGVVSSVMSLFNYNLRLLMWIDMWGTTMGWILRVALIIVGAALFFMFNKDEEEEEEEGK